MFKYGSTSTARKSTCHPDLVRILDEVIKIVDFCVLCGVRSKEDQTAALVTRKSQVKWPRSMHNVDEDNPRCAEFPDKSCAFDVAEYHSEIKGHINWGNKQEMWANAIVILSVAKSLKERGVISHSLRWGGDWDGDGIPVFLDETETFWDAVHFELVL